MTQNNWVFNRQIKEAVGIEDDYTAEDTTITRINNAVTKTLEDLMGRCLTKNAYTEYFNSKSNGRSFYDVYGYAQAGTGTAYKEIKYQLKNFPVDLAETFEVHYTPQGLVDASTILTEDDYTFDAETGTLIITKPVASYYRAIRVVYTAGYESTLDTDATPAPTAGDEEALSYNIPSDLVQAALWQAAHTYEKSKFSNINVRESRSQGSTNTARYVNIHAIAPEAMAVIVRYKKRFVRFV